MDQKKLFLEKLNLLKEEVEIQGKNLDPAHISQFFADMNITKEQSEMILEYMKGRGGTSEPAELSPEDKRYLEEYKKTLAEEPQSPPFDKYMETVVQTAVKYAGRGIALSDLIQEGNVGLVAGLQEKSEDMDKAALGAIRRAVIQAVEEYEGQKAADERMVEKVNELVDKIKELTEELGYKPSVDEVSHYLDMPAEEVRNLLYLAGEEVEAETEIEIEAEK